MRLGRLLLVPGVRYDRFSLECRRQRQRVSGDTEPGAGRFLGRGPVRQAGRLAAARRTPSPCMRSTPKGSAPRPTAPSTADSPICSAATRRFRTPISSRRPATTSRPASAPACRGSASASPVSSIATTTSSTRSCAAPIRRRPARVPVSERRARSISAASSCAARRILSRTLRAERRATPRSAATTSPRDIDVPLNSIAPNQGAVGLAYAAASNRWGSDLTVRAARGQSPATAGAGFFAPDAFAVADVTGWADADTRRHRCEPACSI